MSDSDIGTVLWAVLGTVLWLGMFWFLDRSGRLRIDKKRYLAVGVLMGVWFGFVPPVLWGLIWMVGRKRLWLYLFLTLISGFVLYAIGMGYYSDLGYDSDFSFWYGLFVAVSFCCFAVWVWHEDYKKRMEEEDREEQARLKEEDSGSDEGTYRRVKS